MSYARGFGAYYSIDSSAAMPFEAVGVFNPGGGGTTPSNPAPSPAPGDPAVGGGVAFDSNAEWAQVTMMQNAYNTFYATTAGLSPSDPIYLAAQQALGPANYASWGVANKLRAVLAQLGYATDPAMNTQFGSQTDCTSYGQFLKDYGMAPGYGLCGVAKNGFDKLQQVNDQWLLDHKTPGPLPPTICTSTGGVQYDCQKGPPSPTPVVDCTKTPADPSCKKVAPASSMWMWALGAAAIAGVAIVAQKKKKPV